MVAEPQLFERSELPQSRDVENQVGPRRRHRFLAGLFVSDGEVYDANEGTNSKWYRWLRDAGVEANGIKPVPRELRTESDSNKLFTVFFTCLLCILPLVPFSNPS